MPHILETPRRQLTGSWAEYGLTDGTPYFYNVETGTTSWRPPGEQTPDDGELSVRATGLGISGMGNGRKNHLSICPEFKRYL